MSSWHNRSERKNSTLCQSEKRSRMMGLASWPSGNSTSSHSNFSSQREDRCSPATFDSVPAKLYRYSWREPVTPRKVPYAVLFRREEEPRSSSWAGWNGGFHGIHKDSYRGGESEGKVIFYLRHSRTVHSLLSRSIWWFHWEGKCFRPTFLIPSIFPREG